MSIDTAKNHSPRTIPEGWDYPQLKELATIKYGKNLPTKNLAESGYPVFGANGVIGYYDRYLYEEPQVLISCRGAYSGKINWSPGSCFVTNNSLVLEVPNGQEELKRYLFYALQAIDKSKLVSGTAQPQVTINNAEVLQIPLAPKNQRKAIVAEIEKQFSRLDEAVANLKRVKANLKRYKAAVLKAAVEGSLVIAGPEGIRETTWNFEPIDVAIASLDQGWSPRCDNEPSRSSDSWGVIKTTAVQSMRYVESENKQLPTNLKPRPHLELNADDLLITRAGPRAHGSVWRALSKPRGEA